MGLPVVAELGAALNLVAFVAHADPALVVRKVVHAAVDVFVDDRRRLQKCFFNIGGGLSGCLHEDQTMLTSEHLSFVGAHLSSRIQVTLISDKHDRHIGVSVLFDLLEPSGQVREGVPPSDVVHEQGTSRAAVIRAGDALERFLSGRVPDVKV